VWHLPFSNVVVVLFLESIYFTGVHPMAFPIRNTDNRGSYGHPREDGTGGPNKDIKKVAQAFGSDVSEKTMHDLLGKRVDATQGKGLSPAEREAAIAKMAKGYAKDIGSANIDVGTAVDAWRAARNGAPGAIGR
jgi:hypothetical protein